MGARTPARQTIDVLTFSGVWPRLRHRRTFCCRPGSRQPLRSRSWPPSTATFPDRVVGCPSIRRTRRAFRRRIAGPTPITCVFTPSCRGASHDRDWYSNSSAQRPAPLHRRAHIAAADYYGPVLATTRDPRGSRLGPNAAILRRCRHRSVSSVPSSSEHSASAAAPTRRVPDSLPWRGFVQDTVTTRTTSLNGIPSARTWTEWWADPLPSPSDHDTTYPSNRIRIDLAPERPDDIAWKWTAHATSDRHLAYRPLGHHPSRDPLVEDPGPAIVSVADDVGRAEEVQHLGVSTGGFSSGSGSVSDGLRCVSARRNGSSPPSPLPVSRPRSAPRCPESHLGLRNNLHR